jgi:hypothetical protein
MIEARDAAPPDAAKTKRAEKMLATRAAKRATTTIRAPAAQNRDAGRA